MKSPILLALTVLLNTTLLFQTADAEKLKQGKTKLLSKPIAGLSHAGGSSYPDISKSGRYVVFASNAANLLPNQMEMFAHQQIILHDRVTGSRELISTGLSDQPADADCASPSISDDGRIVVYQSKATNLTKATEMMGFTDIFVVDRQFDLHFRLTWSWTMGEADANCTSPVVSGDGQFVAFHSKATNLTMSASNGKSQIYRKAIAEESGNELVSVNKDGNPGGGHSYNPSPSFDGRYVAFNSTAPDIASITFGTLHQVWMRDCGESTTSLISTKLPLEGGDSHSYFPQVSASGRFVAYSSFASNLTSKDKSLETVDLFVHDRKKGTTKQIVVKRKGKAVHSYANSISDSGRYVGCSSYEFVKVGGMESERTLAYRVDTKKKKSQCVAKSSGGKIADNDCYSVRVSGTGKFVVFQSYASNLAKDENSNSDVFIRRP